MDKQNFNHGFTTLGIIGIITAFLLFGVAIVYPKKMSIGGGGLKAPGIEYYTTTFDCFGFTYQIPQVPDYGGDLLCFGIRYNKTCSKYDYYTKIGNISCDKIPLSEPLPPSYGKGRTETQKSLIDISTWRTYQLAHPFFAHWEIKFPQTFHCPEGFEYPCSKGPRIDENGKVILSENNGPASLTLCTEDFANDVTPPAIYCVSVEDSKEWSSSLDFFSYIKLRFADPEDIAKAQRQNVTTLKINEPIVINGSTVVKVETKAENTYIDRYFIEKDSQNFLRISIAKHKLSESQKRASEIDSIISSFRFLK